MHISRRIHHARIRQHAGDIAFMPLNHFARQVEALYYLCFRAALFVDRGAGPNKIIEWREGDVTGMLPYSRLVSPPGDAIALEPVEILLYPVSILGR